MLTFLKRPLYVLSNKIRRNNPENITEEKWIADFSKPNNSPFDIKSESLYNAYLSNSSLVLDLKKTNCIAWVETPEHHYQDQVIEARFRLDSLGGYAAAGLMFRVADDGTYYLALVSSKGYFRLDAVKDNSPQPLIGWTEAAGFNGKDVSLGIIAYGAQLIFFINGRWCAETSDATISGGRLGFALASYEGESDAALAEISCRAWLDFLSVDSRISAVEESVNKWSNSPEITAESRLHLAETFAAMGADTEALTQIGKAWERREDAARSVMATYTEMRTRRELLLAARMAFRLERYSEADEYIDACLEQGVDTPEGKEALAEKAKILGELNKFAELKDFMLKHLSGMSEDSGLYALLANAHWKMNEYEPAAMAWDKAFELEKENGIYAVNAANAWELLGKNDKALERFLEAGGIFLRQDNHGELVVLVPKLISLGDQNWAARALAGKWAFSIEDYDRAETEFAASERVRRTLKPKPASDPAVSYLRALILILKGKHKEAARFLEEAVRLAPDYGLFRFKLAENRMLLCGDVYDPELAEDLQTALNLMSDDIEMTNYAGTLLLRTGDCESAGDFFNKALAVDPDNVEYLSNQVSCLMACGLFNQAGELLAQARLRKPSPGLNDLIEQVNSGINPFFKDGVVPAQPSAAARAAAARAATAKVTTARKTAKTRSAKGKAAEDKAKAVKAKKGKAAAGKTKATVSKPKAGKSVERKTAAAKPKASKSGAGKSVERKTAVAKPTVSKSGAGKTAERKTAVAKPRVSKSGADKAMAKTVTSKPKAARAIKTGVGVTKTAKAGVAEKSSVTRKTTENTGKSAAKVAPKN
ncbi:hypothetical protein AGMMS50293_22750 [Spirochaetia bacterium]|nr:hypothetical protein AGMMS50293_22750 [Spirochaetia bacterium]